MTVIIVLGILQSCETSYYEDISNIIDDSNYDYNTITINGFITSEKKYHSVTITKPMDLLSQNFDSVTGALVYLKIGNEIFEYLESLDHSEIANSKKQKGVYYSKDSIQGKVGLIHTIFIEYNGENYSASDSMVESTPLEITEINLPHLDNTFEASLHGQDNSIFFSIKNHQFGYDRPNRFNWITKQVGLNEFRKCVVYNHNTIEPQGMLSEWNAELSLSAAINDTIWVEKYSISQRYEDYLISVFKETQWKTGFFSSISANTKTNVSNGGFGFFYATAVVKKYILAKDLKELIEKNR